MFQAKIRADILKKMIDIVSPLVNEVKIKVTPAGMSLRAVDPAHVAMVDLSISASAFEEYKADETEIGIDLDKLASIMKLASSGDTVEMELDDVSNRLIIRIGNLTRKIGLIDTTGMTEPKVPNLNLPAKITVKASELLQGVKASESISDHIALTATEDTFELFAEGDTDTVNLKLPKDLLIELNAPEKCRSLFSVEYLSSMMKPVKGDQPLTIYLGNDNPIKLEFDFADKNARAIYLLAPRIESE